MNVLIKSGILLPVMLALSGCGAGLLKNGGQQSVNVDVFPHTASGVSCVLENERGAWSATSVPQAVQVERAYGPLSVKCRSTDGQTGSAIVSSSSDTLGTAASVLAGPISVTQDIRSGGMFGYPQSIVVTMKYTTPPPVRDAIGAPVTVYATSPVVGAVHHARRPVRHTANRIPSK